MNYVEGELPVLELTRRNLNSLLAKLDGHPPDSACTLIDPDGKIVVKAVEDAEHYSDRPPGPIAKETEKAFAPYRDLSELCGNCGHLSFDHESDSTWSGGGRCWYGVEVTANYLTGDRCPCNELIPKEEEE